MKSKTVSTMQIHGWLCMTALLLFCITHPTHAQPRGTVTVLVTGLKTSNGTVRVALYNEPKEFPRGKVFKRAAAPITNGKATVQFEGLELGEYAIALMHDENGNGVMDYNFMGIPTEPYAFSNNVKAVLAPPSFDKAKFTVKAASEQAQTLQISCD